MELVEPSIKYKESFLEALEEYQKEKESDLHLRSLHYKDLSSSVLRANFEIYINSVLSKARGEDLPQGYVPETTYWLVDNGEFIGRVSIRHETTEQLLREGGFIGYDIRPSKRGKGYGNKILELSLSKAKVIGWDKVLITCNANNIPSKKVIEKNGGRLENSIETKEGPRKLRYWIELNNF